MNSTTLSVASATMDITDFMATVALFTWTFGFLLFITAKGNHDHQFGQTNPDQKQEEPRTTDWKHIGIYYLNKPQTLKKAEREALAAVGGNASYLYERTYKSGAKSWRYRIGDTWFYPTETSVRRRGLDLFGNDTLDIE